MSTSSTKKRWIPLEANPDVMNQFIWGLGVPEKEVELNDVYGLDEELLAMVPKPVLAVLFLFPYTVQTEAEKNSGNEQGSSTQKKLWREVRQFDNVRARCAFIKRELDHITGIGSPAWSTIAVNYFRESCNRHPIHPTSLYCIMLLMSDSSAVTIHAGFIKLLPDDMLQTKQ